MTTRPFYDATIFHTPTVTEEREPLTEDSQDFSWGEMTRLPQPRRSKGTIFRFSTAISTLVLWPPIFFIVVFIIGHACLGF